MLQLNPIELNQCVIFTGQLQFNEIRKRILRLGIEMATSAQRDRFVENPVDQVFTSMMIADRFSVIAILFTLTRFIFRFV